MAIQDGYDQDETYEIFKNPLILQLFDVSNGVPEEFFKSAPQQFAGAYQHVPPFDIELPGLPVRMVSCLSYSIVKMNKHEAILAGFSFDVPGSEGATSGITSIGPTEIYPVDAKSNCAVFVQNYIAKHLKDLKPLNERRTMASLASMKAHPVVPGSSTYRERRAKSETGLGFQFSGAFSRPSACR